jgi:very-short-patch-repair endonuclease
MSVKSKAEDDFAFHLRAVGIDAVRQYRFAPPRKWLADFAILDESILIEIEGGVFVGGRHTRGTGYTNDIEKYNAATLDGWRLLRFTTDHVNDGSALRTVMLALAKGHKHYE